MPAASIVNGRTGEAKVPSASDVNDYLLWLQWGAGLDSALSPEEVARRTAGGHLHVCEFWLPGGCNLRCRHCYVASWQEGPSLSGEEFAALARRLVTQGLVDVVVPGMEPLLRAELWSITAAAREAGARSIGITTNGTLLYRKLPQILNSGITVVNVSVDGPKDIHDSIRGRGVFDVVLEGIRKLRHASQIRLITNCTVNRANLNHLVEIARIAGSVGATYAAFHPFETSSEIDNEALSVSGEEIATAYEELIEAFSVGIVDSLVLETEASTFAGLLVLHERGLLKDFELVSDDTGFLFLRKVQGSRELLVNLMGYPHHFTRTIRVADNGGLSSCRNMAQSGWAGLGDLRRESLGALLSHREILHSLSRIWGEFRRSVTLAGAATLEAYIEDLSSRPTSSLLPRAAA